MLEAALARLAPYRLLAIAVVICGLAVGLVRLGFVMADTARSAEIATLKRNYANAMAAAERQAREQLQAQAARGDALTQQLAEQQAVAYRQAQEKDRAIHALTTGRPCLDARLVGVLNGTGGASVVADPVPTPTGSAAPADAPVATDTDVAHWARIARQALRRSHCIARPKTAANPSRKPAAKPAPAAVSAPNAKRVSNASENATGDPD